MGELLPQLYLHGLAAGDFDQALRGLLGDEAPLSPSSIVRLKAKWQQEYDAWCQRSLADLEVVYLWVDGIYVKAGLEKEKSALFGRRGGAGRRAQGDPGRAGGSARVDGELVVAAPGPEAPGDEVSAAGDRRWTPGDLGALANVYPEAGEQRCWNHRVLNVLDRVPTKKQAPVKVWMREMMYAPTREKAEEQKGKFQSWCERAGLEEAGRLLEEDWERLVAYYGYPQEHWTHLRTTNPVESPFAAVRLRTTAAKRYKRVENATAMIWKLLKVAEQSFRK